ncbi:expressed unknown protein [Seminavis robusta]|uniref:Uncharacterized protein n=1 Tax=Seminavis robusta TaxID=568900 RepID=A0A9N8HB24_9STRA|nr:expressed unknown protein [Seminavis robusta]|eukprot:Sro344_g122310.1 n/a (391) ;mRNA; f:64518-65690
MNKDKGIKELAKSYELLSNVYNNNNLTPGAVRNCLFWVRRIFEARRILAPGEHIDDVRTYRHLLQRLLDVTLPPGKHLDDTAAFRRLVDVLFKRAVIDDEILEQIGQRIPTFENLVWKFPVESNVTMNAPKATLLARLVQGARHVDLSLPHMIHNQHVYVEPLALSILRSKTLESLSLVLKTSVQGANSERAGNATKALALAIETTMAPLIQLTLKGTSVTVGTDLTDGIVSLLAPQGTKPAVIQRIYVDEFMVRHEPIFQALANNSTLTHLTIPSCRSAVADPSTLLAALEINTTLQCFELLRRSPGDFRFLRKKVRYNMKLNQYGKAKVRNPGTSRSEFVGLLGLALATEPTGAIVYGLLRENPQKWCFSQPQKVKQTRKRKSVSVTG